MMIITLTVENCHITEKKERKNNLLPEGTPTCSFLLLGTNHIPHTMYPVFLLATALWSWKTQLCICWCSAPEGVEI